MWKYVSRLIGDKLRFRAFLQEANELLKCNDLGKLKHERALLTQNFHLSPNADIIELNKAKGRLDQKEATLQTAIDQAAETKRVQQQNERDALVSKISKVYAAFRAQGHTETIPESCKDFPEEIIDMAKNWHQIMLDQEREEQRKLKAHEANWIEAVKFVWKYHALPAHFQSMGADGKDCYEKALQLDKEGKLGTVVAELREEEHEQRRKDYLTNDDYVQLAGSVEAGKAREKELVQKDFYLASELTKVEQNFLLQFHGFKSFNSSDDGSKLIPVIYHCTTQESPAHFCSKHLFARLHPSAKIEYVDAWRNEVDIMFSRGKQKLAVEIERGTNKPDDVRQKIASLSKANYAKIIVVVPRKMRSKYRQHHDGKKVFVLTPKNAKEAILEWLE
ncbi:MAG: hypothetical protein HZB68_04495 [Candidatus Aenigmarchaeota archaeon]|nr:hypothetical protein [Candidatus Aenigmarchaeota archaeon]